MRLGIAAVTMYVLMSATIWGLYVESWLRSGDIARIVKPLEVLSLVLVTLGFRNRRKSPQKHREYLVFGTFCLIGPALDRTAFHLFGPEGFFYPMLILYVVLAGSFAWATRRIRWYLVLWLLSIAWSLHPLVKDHFS